MTIGGRHSPAAKVCSASIASIEAAIRSAPSRSALLTTKMSAISMMPGLERLHVVAGARHQRHDRDVGRADDVDFVLADADGLDDHDILAAGVEHQRDLARGAGEAAEVAARRHAADEHAGVAGVRLHAHAIAEDGAAGVTGWWDRRRRCRPSGRRRAARRSARSTSVLLPAPGGPVMPSEVGAPGVRKDAPDQVGAGGGFVLDQRDGAGDRPRIAGEDAGGERLAGAPACARRSLRQQLPGDHQALDLARAFADGAGA